ncbi:hypothetical protein DJ71_01400 [Halorubrum sp. E3]|nr:hypothetical protein DJ71_01400 [Halorubrum sp. E3]
MNVERLERAHRRLPALDVDVVGRGVGVEHDGSRRLAARDRGAAPALDHETSDSLATVEARVADGLAKQYVGLSETDALAADEGMLFVHDETGEHAYVMRGMAFGLEIVFVAPDGTVTRIHEAEPESRPHTRYHGTGRYVLEVPRGWSERNGVDPGDRLVFDLD